MNPRLKRLLDRQAEILTTMETLNESADTDNRDLNEEESKRYADAEVEVQALAPRIEREQALAERRRSASTSPLSTIGGSTDDDADSSTDGDPDDGGSDAHCTDGGETRSDRIPRYAGGLTAGGLPIGLMHASRRGRHHYATARSRKPVFRSFGHQLQAIAAASDTAKAGHTEAVNRLTAVQDEYDRRMDASGASADLGSDGAWLVQKEFTLELMETAEEEAILLPMTRSIEIGEGFDSLEAPFIDEASRADGSRFGGVQVYWAAEADAVSAKKPKIGKHEIRLEEMHALAYATKRLLRDTTALASIFESAFASDFAFKIDDSIINGHGAGQMLGILHAKNAALVAVDKDGSQTAKTITVTNITNIWSAMWARSRRRPSAVWLYNQDIETQLLTLAIEGTSSSVPVFVPPGGLSVNPFPTILGKTAIAIEQAATLGDKGDIGLYDLSEYVVVRKGGLISERSMHVRFIQHEETFRWTMAINGQPAWRSSKTPFKGTQARSPYVTVAART